MKPGSGRNWFRFVGIPAVSSLAFMLVAAGVDVEQNWARLRALPKDQRKELVENLRRFDLVLSAEQRKALTDLDGGIQSLEPSQRIQYMASLRRYHIWLGLLPENLRDAINSAAPTDRMALIKKTIADGHPLPKVDTGRYLKVADLGEFSPFELAAVYKVWQTLKPDQRQRIEKMPRGPRRIEQIFSLDKSNEIGREVKPEGFDEEHWLEKLETDFRAVRPAMLFDELKKKGDPRRGPILRRQAINYYFALQNIPAVAPERLESFVASFPSFLHDSFEQFPPDEARRRMTIVYRLVFPPGKEMKTVPGTIGAPGPTAGAAASPASGKPNGTPAPPAAKPPRETAF